MIERCVNMDKQLKFDSFNSIVICSTLNQVVNYIPIMLHKIDFEEIYSIRMENSDNELINKKFNYDNWDNNLEKVLNMVQHEQRITFRRNEITSHEFIIKELRKYSEKNLKDKKVLWNITGGQRHFVMAITEFVFSERPNDTIMYYDGDNEKIYYYRKNKKILPRKILKENVNFKISILKALRLMGFHVKGRENLDEPSNYYKNMKSDKIGNSDEYKWYKNFYNLYCKEGNEKLREILINSNRFQNDKNDEKEITRTVLDKIIEEIEKSDLNTTVKEMFEGEKGKTLKNSISKHKKGKAFGYMLEKMTLYNLIEVISKNSGIKNVIADIDADISVDDGNSSSNETVDQFDVMIATKYGKIIMFECKSGSMGGDTAKSNNYSTYAISGAYGMPIIVIPVINKKDVFKVVKFETNVLKLNSRETDVKGNENLYEQIEIAVESAERANLEVCCISQLECFIEKYINVK